MDVSLYVWDLSLSPVVLHGSLCDKHPPCGRVADTTSMAGGDFGRHSLFLSLSFGEKGGYKDTGFKDTNHKKVETFKKKFFF